MLCKLIPCLYSAYLFMMASCFSVKTMDSRLAPTISFLYAIKELFVVVLLFWRTRGSRTRPSDLGLGSQCGRILPYIYTGDQGQKS